MATIKFKSALGVERMHEEGFGGIDRTQSKGNCYLAENLNPCADGSMKTRAGYTALGEYQGNLRASLNFFEHLYSVIGDSLIVTNINDGSSEIIAKLDKSEGEADIFCLGGDIYIHDGLSFFRLKDGVVNRVEGYAPLYGNGWDPSARGLINEDINLLSDRIRISFNVTYATGSFYLGFKAASVDYILINGTIVDPSEINAHIDEDDPSLLRTTIINGGATATFWFTLSPESSEMHRIKQATKAFIFGNNGGERLCLYNPGNSCNLYSSRPVNQWEQFNSELSFPGALPLYVPISSALCIGSGVSPITEIAHHYSRGILFTETDAWFIDWDGEEGNKSVEKPKSFMLNSAIGAEHILSNAYFDNDPITYFCGRLWRWHSVSGVRDECSASMISDAVAELIPKDSEKISMLSLPQEGKVFISDAEDITGKLLVYDLMRGTWTSYSGIFAERLFRYGNSPAFSRGGCIYTFTDEALSDNDVGESFKIRSKLVTHFFDFGAPEKIKRSANLLIEQDLSGGAAKLTLENEHGEKTSMLLHGKSVGGREQFSVHIRLPRFKKLRLTIESVEPVRIYGLVLSAK